MNQRSSARGRDPGRGTPPAGEHRRSHPSRPLPADAPHPSRPRTAFDAGYRRDRYDERTGSDYPGVGVYEGVGGYPGGGRVDYDGYRGGAGDQSGAADYARGDEPERYRDEYATTPAAYETRGHRRHAAAPAYHAGYGGGEREHMPRGYGEGAAYWMRTDEDDRSSVYGRVGPRVAGGHRGKGPKGYVRSDERIREDLSEQLAEDDAVDPGDVSIEVRDGVVTLSGSVEERWVKHRIEDMAEACRGVTDVINHLRIVHVPAPGGG